MVTITGYVDHIVFRNEDNGYTVFQLNNDDGELTCVGQFPFLSTGELVELAGEYITHPQYGVQLQVERHELKEPEDIVSMERYLGSGAVKGVGVALAGRIIRRFKEDTFRIMEEEPERLAEIKGISARKAREIASQMEEKKDLRKAMIYLQKYGISLSLAAKIYDRYGASAYRILEENPYRIADDIPGVGFKTADDIASRIGIHADSDYRIRSGIFYTLLDSVAEGHVYLPKEVLLKRAAEILGVDIENIEKYLMDLSIEKKVILKEEEGMLKVYAAHYYYLELNTARMLHDLNFRTKITDEAVDRRLEKIEQHTELELDERQRTAVRESVKNGVLLLTGGPGTGKTTTINAIIEYFEAEHASIYLAAPTGRAAKRMTEATGHEAQTIHRLLEVSGNPEDESERNGFLRNEENPLDADLIIIDEMSMVDISLMHALLSAIVVGTRLIMVGDENQLPPVGPGSVLKDVLASHCFPMVMLTKIFRQAKESDIVMNAHKMLHKEPIILDNKSKDFFFLKRSDANTIIGVMLTLVKNKLPGYVEAKPYDIQVLAPMRKGLLGVERLNGILQEYLNPPGQGKAEYEAGDRLFRVGDKVMQIKNNYQLEWEVATRYGMTIDKGVGVFNGDMGIVKTINDYEETMTVEFDEQRCVTYPFKLIEELELAYAVTIHKSQGSEYPAVVIPLLSGPSQLYHRNLIYTAITRAKRCVTLVGSDETFYSMVSNDRRQERNTGLKKRICEIYSDN